MTSYRQEHIRFISGSGYVSGRLCLPDTGRPCPVVVLIAGSGPAGYDGYGIYPQMWEAFAQIGVASFSWDKPGVGDSEGDWKSQTNEDRAQEALAAITALKARSDIDQAKIGLWGISQAGWILPIAYSLATTDVAFIIAVSAPGDTGAQQELYRVRATLTAEGYSASDIERAVSFTQKRLALLEQASAFEVIDALQKEVEQLTWFGTAGRLDEHACRFLSANAFFSPRPLLQTIVCPVLAIYGDKDFIVDAVESAQAYAESLAIAGNKDFTIRTIHNGDHVIFENLSGTPAELERSFQKSEKTFAPGYLDSMTVWLQQRFCQ